MYMYYIFNLSNLPYFSSIDFVTIHNLGLLTKSI